MGFPLPPAHSLPESVTQIHEAFYFPARVTPLERSLMCCSVLVPIG